VFAGYPHILNIIEAQTHLRHNKRVRRHIEDNFAALNTLKINYRSDRKEEIRPPPTHHRVAFNAGMPILNKEALNLTPSINIVEPPISRRIT